MMEKTLILGQHYSIIVIKLFQFLKKHKSKKKILQNMRTLQGYIFLILQHFATKLCNLTKFSICSF